MQVQEMIGRPQANRVRRTVGVVACALVLATIPPAWADVLPSVEPEQVGLSSERLERIDQALQDGIDEGELPGAVVLVARRGQIAYSQTFGVRDPASGEPMPRDAIFRVYSMTKPLVSVAAMILMEEGALQLADPVSRFLPEFRDLQVSVPETDAAGRTGYRTEPSEREMTVQDLLRHTAGLAYGEITDNEEVRRAYAEADLYQPDGPDYDSRGMTPDEQIERLAEIPLIHEPGTLWEYGLDSDLLGRIVERVSGMELGAFMEERLFGPLGMVDTGFHVAEPELPRLAEPLATDPTTGEPIELIDVSAPPANASGGAGAVSTASDYLRFGQMLLNGGELDGARVLSRTTVRLMTADHLGTKIPAPGLEVLAPGYTFGLGLGVRTEPGIAPVSGSVGEFMFAGHAGTTFWVDPVEELVGILMTQAPPGPIQAYYTRHIRQLVYQAIGD